MFNEYIKKLEKMCYENFGTILSVAILMAAGGLSTLLYGWIGAVIIPAWVAFAAFVLKRGHKE